MDGEKKKGDVRLLSILYRAQHMEMLDLKDGERREGWKKR
jgi:hypothetical protein